jgi:hypothetical protein
MEIQLELYGPSIADAKTEMQTVYVEENWWDVIGQQPFTLFIEVLQISHLRSVKFTNFPFPSTEVERPTPVYAKGSNGNEVPEAPPSHFSIRAICII